jgi:multidrug transporter EmrE-like cation transporter
MPPDVSPALAASGANRRLARAVDRFGVVGLVRTVVIGDRRFGEKVDVRRLIRAALIPVGIIGIVAASAQ